jgi:hypothetical protein
MKMSINCINVLQSAVQEIYIRNKIITFSSSIIESWLTSRPLTADPRFEFVTPGLPLFLNFLMTTFEDIGLPNPFHIYNPWPSCRLLKSFCQLL